MKSILTAFAVVLLLGSTAYGGWYVVPTPVRAYYPAYAVAPAYAYPAPVPYAAYYAPVAVAPVPYATYYAPVVPYAAYARVVAPAPVWVGPPGVVVRTKVFIPGRPVRNVVRAVLP
jgi:hypothetical protein